MSAVLVEAFIADLETLREQHLNPDRPEGFLTWPEPGNKALRHAMRHRKAVEKLLIGEYGPLDGLHSPLTYVDDYIRESIDLTDRLRSNPMDKGAKERLRSLYATKGFKRWEDDLRQLISGEVAIPSDGTRIPVLLDEHRGSIIVGERVHGCTGRPFELARGIIRAEGAWGSRKSIFGNDKARADRYYKRLPRQVKALFESKRGKGYRLKSRYYAAHSKSPL